VTEPILLTGATGFLGTHLARRLAADGLPLRALVRPTSDTAELEQLGIELAIGDVTDWQAVCAAVDGCRRVVHMANIYSMWESEPALYQRVNVEGTRRVAQAAAESGVDLFLHVSSVVVFGRPDEVPFHERCAPGPERFSEYARTKFEADRVVEEFAVSHRLPVAILYPASILGPGDRKSSGRYIDDIINRRLPMAVFSDDVLTWVHVNDVTDAIGRLLLRPDAAGARYVIGRHRLTMHQINEMIHEISGVLPPRYEMPDWLARLTARVLTGWASVTGQPPLWGLSTDITRTLVHSIQADGTRAERDLGLQYSDVRTAIADTIGHVDIGGSTA
jgi:dihydroflavonol-4-reductase